MARNLLRCCLSESFAGFAQLGSGCFSLWLYLYRLTSQVVYSFAVVFFRVPGVPWPRAIPNSKVKGLWLADGRSWAGDGQELMSEGLTPRDRKQTRTARASRGTGGCGPAWTGLWAAVAPRGPPQGMLNPTSCRVVHLYKPSSTQ